MRQGGVEGGTEGRFIKCSTQVTMDVAFFFLTGVQMKQ